MLDTNAIISFLKGEFSIVELVSKADIIGISVISKLEFLAFDGLTEKDEIIFSKFCERIETYDLNPHNQELMEKIISVRKKYKLKLPDAIIAATAIVNNAILITDDKSFYLIQELKVHS